MSQGINIQIIKEARALLGDEEKWCRKEMAFDRYGRPVCATDEGARRWCAYGALVAAAHAMTSGRSQAFDLADGAAALFGGCDALMRDNDTRGHTTVLALFDEVIRRCQTATCVPTSTTRSVGILK
jgi:hypothetical protein